jgi:hypothetical protein
MPFPMKWLYAKYCSFIIKMHVENAKGKGALRNLNASCDIELISRLPLSFLGWIVCML